MNSEIIDASIELELTVADLYFLFYESFPEDSDFWWKMSLEEKSHAAILRSGKESFEPINIFPHELVYNSLSDLKNTIKSIREKIKEIKNNPISREEAFELAIEIEQTAGEHHYQEFMTKTQNEPIIKLFQKLNGADKDHIQKLLNYMAEKGMK